MTEARVQRRLAAIAIADVVGYSRLMGCDEDGTLAALNARRRDVIEPEVAAHGGRVVKLLGDGFFLEFSSTLDALEAALAIHAGMAEANASLSADKHMTLRIGINLGEVIVEGDDLFGDGVNVAARLESIAPQGGIALSASAQEQLRNRVAVAIDDAGLHTLKNIAGPVHVYTISALSADAAAPAPRRTAPPPSRLATEPAAAQDPRPTIAVLPFANLDDPAQAYFSDGISQDIVTELSRWRRLSVRSLSASSRYRGVAQDLHQVARELDVRYLLEGSVRRLGERLRVTAQLIDTQTGSHVWAERFDRPAQDFFALQDEMVRTIVATLVGRVQAADAERARRKLPASLAAWECLLRGNALSWNEPAAAAEARQLFERAIELDPGYGLAHALLSTMHGLDWVESLGEDQAALEQAHALAQRAVALDETESTCWAMLAINNRFRGAWTLSRREIARAVELNPGNPSILADRGLLEIAFGEHAEAEAWQQRAFDADPYFDPGWFSRTRGQALLHLGRPEEALAMFERVPPPSWRSDALVAATLARLGQTAAAKTRIAACLALQPRLRISSFLRVERYRRDEDAGLLSDLLARAGLPA